MRSTVEWTSRFESSKRPRHQHCGSSARRTVSIFRGRAAAQAGIESEPLENMQFELKFKRLVHPSSHIGAQNMLLLAGRSNLRGMQSTLIPGADCCSAQTGTW